MDHMEVDTYDQRIEQLEDDELELKATAELYIELLALYLCRNELIEAKNLLLRIPPEMKAENKEITHLEVLFNALNVNNNADFFKNVNCSWSENIKGLMQQIKEKTLENVFQLVGHAYTSIHEQDLLHMTKMNRDDLKQKLEKLGWTYEEDGQQVIILPKPQSNPSSTFGSSKDQLFKLTEFVTFLEN